MRRPIPGALAAVFVVLSLLGLIWQPWGTWWQWALTALLWFATYAIIVGHSAETKKVTR